MPYYTDTQPEMEALQVKLLREAPPWQKMKMLAALKDGNYEGAAREALDSKWARQVGKRSERVAALLKSPNFVAPTP